MKLSYTIILSLLLLLYCGACSSNNNEPEQEVEIESVPLAKITNSDGSYYTLHDSYVSLRSASDAKISRLYFDAPDPLTVNTGYGKQEELYYKPTTFNTLGSFIVAGYNVTYYSAGNDKWIYDFAPGYLYLFNESLTSYSKKEIPNGLMLCQNNLFVSVNDSFGYTLYDKNLTIVKQSDGIDNLEPLSYWGQCLLSPVNSKYYLLCNAKANDKWNTLVIVNLSDEVFNEVQLPTITEIITEYFPEETVTPRLDETLYSMDGNNYMVTYTFTLYNGSIKTVSIKFNLLGEVVK